MQTTQNFVAFVCGRFNRPRELVTLQNNKTDSQIVDDNMKLQRFKVCSEFASSYTSVSLLCLGFINQGLLSFVILVTSWKSARALLPCKSNLDAHTLPSYWPFSSMTNIITYWALVNFSCFRFWLSWINWSNAVSSSKTSPKRSWVVTANGSKY